MDPLLALTIAGDRRRHFETAAATERLAGELRRAAAAPRHVTLVQRLASRLRDARPVAAPAPCPTC